MQFFAVDIGSSVETLGLSAPITNAGKPTSEDGSFQLQVHLLIELYGQR